MSLLLLFIDIFCRSINETINKDAKPDIYNKYLDNNVRHVNTCSYQYKCRSYNKLKIIITFIFQIPYKTRNTT